jgi:hypothetical protein
MKGRLLILLETAFKAEYDTLSKNDDHSKSCNPLDTVNRGKEGQGKPKVLWPLLILSVEYFWSFIHGICFSVFITYWSLDFVHECFNPFVFCLFQVFYCDE